jgi:hypothetical protein
VPHTFEVRSVRRDDFQAWQTLWDGYNAFYGRSGETALPLEVTHTTWSRFFDSQERMHALVAVEAGILLGLAHFLSIEAHFNLRRPAICRTFSPRILRGVAASVLADA